MMEKSAATLQTPVKNRHHIQQWEYLY